MIELATSALVLFSMFYGTSAASTKPVDSISHNTAAVMEDATIVDGIALSAPLQTSSVVESEVREYFKDIPILAEIAKCETHFRHLGEDGEVIQGEVNKGDIGVMQINTFYHADEALKLGIDLKTLRGNLTFAKWLYEKKGTAPWQSSAGCWQKYGAIATR